MDDEPRHRQSVAPSAAASVRLRWTARALTDVERFEAFLAPVAPEAAQRLRQRLLTAPEKLVDFPRIGAPLARYRPREVRRLLVGDYDLRYEIVGEMIEIVEIWHQREDRGFGPVG